METDLKESVIFDRGEINPYGKYFSGTSYLNILTLEGVLTANVTFEPGCINNWHTHRADKNGGQILLVTGGRGWYQEEGKGARELHAGDVVHIPAGVKHWHGAAKDSWFVHIAVEIPGENASNEWHEPVDVNDYNNLKWEIIMILEETYTLSNGVEIPKLGLGTWFISDEDAAQAVKDAVKIGYRHIDTAQAYENENGVGEGIRTCGVNREDIFVTTKLAAEVKSFEEAVASIDGSLQKMGLDYADLMIIHSPQPWMEYAKEDRFPEGNREAWRALEEAHKAGKLRSIGLSNFQKSDIENILESCSVMPMVNQILAHVSNMPTELIQYSQEKGILVEAYSPVGHGELLKNTALTDMAKRYGVSAPRLCIRYILQFGLLPLPKTANPDHMEDNADVDFVISDEDMAFLQNMDQIKDYGDASVFPVYWKK